MKPAATPDTITIHVPFRFIKRGGRKEVRLLPGAPVQRRTDSTLIKALARAFRWKRMLESGEFTTINELAKHEGIAPSHMTRTRHRGGGPGRAAGSWHQHVTFARPLSP